MKPLNTLTRSLRPLLAWLVVFAVVGGAVLLLPRADAQDGADEPSAVFGETTYAQTCAECHGGSGDGGTVPGTELDAPALADRDDMTAAYVDLVLRTGRMPPVGDPFDNRLRHEAYSDAERDAIVAWTIQEYGLIDDRPGAINDGDISRGMASFAQNCAHCHGNTGSGGVAGARAWTPNLTSHDAETIIEGIRVGPFEMPQFNEEQISDQEAADIVAYLHAVEEESGTPLGLKELNPVYASGFVIAMAVFLLGCLWFLGTHPRALEAVSGDMESSPPSRVMTPMPGDPEYEELTADATTQSTEDATNVENIKPLDEGDGE